MRGIAAKAFARGMNVVRLNQRNCGDTEHLSAGLFHSGPDRRRRACRRRTDRASTALPSIAVAGYSLGGNLALKLAGEYGDAPPPALAAVCRRLADPRDQRVRARARAAGQRAVSVEFRRGSEAPDAPQGPASGPGAFDLSKLGRIQDRARVRRGLHGAALRVRGRRGLLPPRQRDAGRRSHPRAGAVITAEDDPFVPSQPFRDPRVDGQPAHHAAHLQSTAGTADSSAPASGDDDGYWAEKQIVEFVERTRDVTSGLSAPRRSPRR